MKKSRLLFTYFLCLTLILTSMSLIGGCKSNELPSLLTGIVEVDNPIEGATIVIYDTGGDLLYKQDEATSDTGLFILDISKPLPVNFRIEADGGRDNVDNEAFTGTLAAEIRGHDEENYSYYHIGPVSTLLAAYMNKHSDFQYDEARTKIMDFLGLHQSINIMTDLLSYKDYFHPEAFETEVKQTTNFNDFIALLVEHVDTEEVEFHDFTSSALDSGLVTAGIGVDITKALLLGLLEGAAGKIGGEATGWIIEHVIGGGEKSELDDIKNDINELSNQITGLSVDLRNGIDRLANLIEMTHYDTRAALLSTEISRIKRNWERIIAVSKLDPGSSTDQGQARRKLDAIDAVQLDIDLQTIHDNLVGTPEVESLLKLLGERSLTNSRKDWESDKYDILENQFAYYAALQLTGLTVLVEKYHAENYSETEINDIIDEYRQRIQAQGDIFLTSVESILAWHCMTESQNHPVYQKEWSFNWKRFGRGGSGNVFDRPIITNVIESQTLRKADKVLGDYLGLENSVTIRVYSSGKTSTYLWSRDFNDPGYLKMRLDYGQNRASITDDVEPIIIKTSYPEHTGTGAQAHANYYAQYARFTFVDLQPGTYYIHDATTSWLGCTPPSRSYGTIPLINRNLLNLPFEITDMDSHHNQLILAWLYEP
ncbi:hypothetical protein ACFLVO_04955 [Chloroflexota bacterium]